MGNVRSDEKPISSLLTHVVGNHTNRGRLSNGPMADPNIPQSGAGVEISHFQISANRMDIDGNIN